MGKASQQHCAAFVPVRGGSRGIPGKNIRPFFGKPLLYWVCQAAQACEAIEAIYVATEDDAIAQTARGLGLSKVQVIGRGAHTATDTASTESALLEFAERHDAPIIALLQATSPLLQPEPLSEGVGMVASGRYDSVLSAVRQRRFIWEAEAGTARPLNYDPQARPRRQDFDGFLVENGAFYVARRERLLESRCRISGSIGLVEMPEDTYFEMDGHADWLIMEGLMQRRVRRCLGTLAERLQAVRFVATDVDGCLTDSGMYYSEQGDELKRFHTRDGKAFELLRSAGLLTGIVTQESRELNTRRAAKLQADELHQGVLDKRSVLEHIAAKRGIPLTEMAYLGDDLNDVEAMRAAGVSACPSDAAPEARAAADVVLDVPGGSGVFRAFAERILAAKRFM